MERWQLSSGIYTPRFISAQYAYFGVRTNSHAFVRKSCIASIVNDLVLIGSLTDAKKVGRRFVMQYTLRYISDVTMSVILLHCQVTCMHASSLP